MESFSDLPAWREGYEKGIWTGAKLVTEVIQNKTTPEEINEALKLVETLLKASFPKGVN